MSDISEDDRACERDYDNIRNEELRKDAEYHEEMMREREREEAET